MAEKKQKPDWNLLKTKVDNFRIRADFALDRAVNEAKYRGLVSIEKHKEASRMAEAFAMESLTFLQDNITAKLGPLHPTADQIRLFQFLFDNTDKGDLLLKSTEGRLHSGRRPFVVKRYEAKNSFEGKGTLSNSLLELYRNRTVRMTVRWGVNEPYPHGFAVFGNMGMAIPRSIDFITFPEQPLKDEDVQKVMQIPKQQKGFTQRVGVFNNGQRIIINRDGNYQGQSVAMTSQYYFLGVFDGQDTGKTYWLYGINGEFHDKMSVSSKVGTSQAATQSSNIHRLHL